MPLIPDLAQECGTLVVTPQDLCITLPGPVDICVQIPDIGFPDSIEIVKQLFAQLNSALTPLTPVFAILDIVVTLVECVKSIPDGLTEIPPFKTLINECLPILPVKLAKLLALLPPVALAITILGFIDALIVLLEGFRNQLNRVINAIARIIDSQTRAAELGSASLDAVVDCANDNVEIELEQFNAGLAPLRQLIAIVGLFADLAGIDISGATVSDAGVDPAAALEPLNETIRTIREIRSTIPL